MARDFEFTQLLRAYRKGIINETTFEQEMVRLEGGATGNGADRGGFAAMGKTYPSEREAIIAYLQRARTGEAAGARSLASWAAVCTTDCIRSSLRTIAEREAYHVRVMDQKLADLGVQSEMAQDPEMEKMVKMQSDSNTTDLEKLGRIVASFPNPDEVVKPIRDFVELIKSDLDAKEMLALWAEDEYSSLKWFLHAYQALGGTAQAAAAAPQMGMSAGAQSH